MDQVQVTVTVILPRTNGGSSADTNNSRRYPIDALRQSSSYFDAMLGGMWLETHDTTSQHHDYDGDGSPVVDLSQTCLDRVACASVLNFMDSRYSAYCKYLIRDGQKEVGILDDGERTMRHPEVTLEEMNTLLWDGFLWDEESSTVDWRGLSLAGALEITEEQKKLDNHNMPPQIHSDEVTLFKSIDFLHVQPLDDVLSKIWAMKLVYCPCFLEDALKNQGLVGSTMYIKRIPKPSQSSEVMWRYLVCMFICRMLVYEEDGKAGDYVKYGSDINVDQIRAMNYRRRLETYDATNQLSYLCLGIGEKPSLLLRDILKFGLLSKEEDCSAYLQTPLDSQVLKLWELLGEIVSPTVR